MFRTIAALFLVLFPASLALAQGFVVPPEGAALDAFTLETQAISITVEDGVASYEVDQEFRNNTAEPIEAEYYFPLPEEASLSDFAIWMEGEPTPGDLLARHRAVEVFERIIQRFVDPGVLEYAESDLIKARIFPIPAGETQRVRVRYQALVSEQGTVGQVQIPLWAPAALAGTTGEMAVHVDLPGELNPAGIYSPTHPLRVARSGDRISVDFREAGARFDQDFWLYYTLDEEPVGLELLTYEAPGEDGYFLLMAAPGELSAGDVIPRDVTFVVDTSGSMSGVRLREIQGAMHSWLDSLSPADRFNVVQFSTEAERMSWDPVVASEVNVRAAHGFVDGLETVGGTNLYEALDVAMAHSPDAGRKHVMVLLTDGRPTLGVTGVDAILDHGRELVAASGADTQVFAMGIGHDVNTRLLETLASDHHGFAEYVRPGEDLQVRATAFYRKVSNPVLTDVELDLGDAMAYDLYPQELPDLYSGSQLLVMGRYQQRGEDPAVLTGRAAGQRQIWTGSAVFAAQSSDSPFIPQLWASRKVGALLEEIRRDGETPERVQAVVALSAQHGIMTPYTSFLSTEDADRPVDDILRPGDPLPEAIPVAALQPPADLRDLSRALGGARDLTTVRTATREFDGFREETGEAAVRASQAIAALRTLEHLDPDAPAKVVGGKVFWCIDGVWVDGEAVAGMAIHTVVLGSEAYFDILWSDPALWDAAALGQRVILVTDDGRALAFAPAA
jgi:Ca-activated chloride channel homolog